MVKRGKPAALISIQKRYLKEALSLIENEYKLRTYCEMLADGWITLWIYKNDYLLDVIKKVPQKPKSVFEHWVLGKLFGYSEEAIQDFLSNQL